jgi:hypothetical protein
LVRRRLLTEAAHPSNEVAVPDPDGRRHLR